MSRKGYGHKSNVYKKERSRVIEIKSLSRQCACLIANVDKCLNTCDVGEFVCVRSILFFMIISRFGHGHLAISDIAQCDQR